MRYENMIVFLGRLNFMIKALGCRCHGKAANALRHYYHAETHHKGIYRLEGRKEPEPYPKFHHGCQKGTRVSNGMIDQIRFGRHYRRIVNSSHEKFQQMKGTDNDDIDTPCRQKLYTWIVVQQRHDQETISM